MRDVDVDAVARLVLDCAGVMGLGDEIATHLPGRRIPGIQIRGETVHLHIVGRYDVTVEALCAEVSAAVQTLAPGHSVDIAVVDMVDPYEFDLST